MECCRVVVVHRMAQLVDDDELLQVARQCRQKERQRYVVARRAAAPLGAGGTHCNASDLEAEALGQRICQRRQGAGGLGAQPLDLLPRDMRYRLASFGHAALSRYDPFGLCVEKGQGASAADQCGVAEPYSARGLDRKAYAARAHRNNALHFAQKRMPDRCHCRPRIYPMR